MNIEFPNVLTAAAAASRPAPADRAAGKDDARAAAPPPAATPDELRETIKAIQAWLPPPVRTSLSFRVDDDLGRVVVSVVDAETGAVVRQIPADVVLRVAQKLQEFLGGLVDEVA